MTKTIRRLSGPHPPASLLQHATTHAARVPRFFHHTTSIKPFLNNFSALDRSNCPVRAGLSFCHARRLAVRVGSAKGSGGRAIMSC